MNLAVSENRAIFLFTMKFNVVAFATLVVVDAIATPSSKYTENSEVISYLLLMHAQWKRPPLRIATGSV